MMGIRCFFLTESDQIEVSLRRFFYSEQGPACPNGRHDASAVIERLAATDAPARYGVDRVLSHGDSFTHDDPRWPKACSCGYEFKPEDEWQFNPTRLHKRSDTGELVTLSNAPVGAMWFAPWFSDSPEYQGPDGQTLVVRLPGNHDWIVDSRARNCTMLGDNVHKCWVRHGTPPDITVDKAGHTCAAGAGSIDIPGWHGFLRGGELVLT